MPLSETRVSGNSFQLSGMTVLILILFLLFILAYINKSLNFPLQTIDIGYTSTTHIIALDRLCVKFHTHIPCQHRFWQSSRIGKGLNGCILEIYCILNIPMCHPLAQVILLGCNLFLEALKTQLPCKSSITMFLFPLIKKKKSLKTQKLVDKEFLLPETALERWETQELSSLAAGQSCSGDQSGGVWRVSTKENKCVFLSETAQYPLISRETLLISGGKQSGISIGISQPLFSYTLFWRKQQLCLQHFWRLGDKQKSTALGVLICTVAAPHTLPRTLFNNGWSCHLDVPQVWI